MKDLAKDADNDLDYDVTNFFALLPTAESENQVIRGVPVRRQQ